MLVCILFLGIDVTCKAFVKVAVWKIYLTHFSQSNISIPPENISKPCGFQMFVGGIKMKHWKQAIPNSDSNNTDLLLKGFSEFVDSVNYSSIFGKVYLII